MALGNTTPKVTSATEKHQLSKAVLIMIITVRSHHMYTLSTQGNLITLEKYKNTMEYCKT